ADDNLANVTGVNITLNALSGGIGQDDPPVVIPLAGLADNIDALELLAKAEAADVVWDDAAGIATVTLTDSINIKMTSAAGELNARAQGNIYIESKDAPIYVKNVDAGQSNVRLLSKHGIYSVNAESDQTVNISGKDLIIEGGDSGAAVSKIGDRTGAADLPIYVSLTGSLEAMADGLINIYQKGASPLTVFSLYSGSGVWLRASGSILSAAAAPDLPEGYINADGKLTLISDTGDIGQDGQGLRILADNVDSVEAAAAGGIYLESESKTAADLTIDGLAAGADGEIKLAGPSGGFYFAGDVAGKNLTIEAQGQVRQDAALSAVAVGKITAGTVGGFAMQGAGNSVDALEVENLDFGDLVFVNSKGLTVDSLHNAATGGKVALTALGDIALMGDVAAGGAVTLDGASVAGAAGTTVQSDSANVAVTASTGDISLRTVKADADGADIALAAAGAVSAEKLEARRDIDIETASGGATIGELIAGNNANITSADGNIVVTDAGAGHDLTMETVTGHIGIQSALASDNINLKTGAGSIYTLGVTAAEDIIMQTGTGDIVIDDGIAGRDVKITITTQGNLNVGEALVALDGGLYAGGDIVINVPHGNVTADLLLADGDITVQMSDGDFQAYYIVAEGDADSDVLVQNTDRGSIDAEYVFGLGSAALKTNHGDLIVTDVIVDKNVTLEALDGEIIIKGEVIAGGDDYIYIGKGDFYDTGTVESLNGRVIIKVGTGDINVNNIAAYTGVSLETVSSGNITATGLIHTVTGDIVIESDNGHIGVNQLQADGLGLKGVGGGVSLTATGAQNGVDAQEIIAAKDVKASAEDGDITIVKVEGTNLWFGIDEDGHTVEIADAFAAESLFAQGEYVDITKITHTASDGYFQLALRGAGGDQPMTYARIGDVTSPAGVQLDQLWAEDADIHVSSEYFRIMEAYALNRAYLSNSRYRMTMFGRDPVTDGADIAIYFAPAAGNPFARVSFQNEFAYLGLENYQILRARDGVVNVVTNQRSLLDDTAIAIASDERIAWRGYAGEWLTSAVYGYGRYLSLSWGDLGTPLDGIYRGGRRLGLGRRGELDVLYYDDAAERQSWQIMDEKRKTL
ncbi:MAG: DUF4097 domain-containing protein, partial [Acidaminococcales bacterium]|nr:DUF4097 domain-containing protein [Acidaminococcales bacterium]